MTSLDTQAGPQTVPPAVPELTPGEREALGRLFDSWQLVATAGHLITPISPLALELIGFDPENEQASRDLVTIVESDPALTARILGLANAAALGRSGKLIFDVHSAVLRLGISTTTRVALAQLAAVWIRRSAVMPDVRVLRPLWIEYLVTAFCASEIAWLLGDSTLSPGVAYVSGLLHDIGTVALLGAGPQLMKRFLEAPPLPSDPLRERFVGAHTALGGAMLRRWGAPATLVEVAERHHAGSSADESIPAIVVYLADHLHERVLERIPSRFGTVPRASHCAEADAAGVQAVIEMLDLGGNLELILGNVVENSGRIESLAADL